MPKRIKLVLCYLVRRNEEGNREVALPFKKRCDGSKNIGAGRRNGYGGSLEPDETERQTVAREVPEESGAVVKPEDLEKIAICEFHNVNDDGSELDCEVHVFIAYEWTGEPRETDEMTEPGWFPIDALPFREMMPSDPGWLPNVFGGREFRVWATLKSNQRELVGEVRVEYVDRLPEN